MTKQSVAMALVLTIVLVVLASYFLVLITTPTNAQVVTVPGGVAQTTKDSQDYTLLIGAGDIVDPGKKDPDKVKLDKPEGAIAGSVATKNLVQKLIDTTDKDVHVFTLGDNAYPSGGDEAYHLFDKIWGQIHFKQGTFATNFHPVAGNHEWYRKGGLLKDASFGRGYFNYFGTASTLEKPDKEHPPIAKNMPVGQWKQEGTSGPWYSYTIGKTYVIALNTNCAATKGVKKTDYGKVNGCGKDDPQGRWLAQELQKARNEKYQCIIAYGHAPRFSSVKEDKIPEIAHIFTGEIEEQPHSSNPELDDIWSLLYSAGADIYMAGHAHTYERFLPMNATPDEQSSPGNKKTDGSFDPRHYPVVNQIDAKKGVTQFIVGTGGSHEWSDLQKNFPYNHVAYKDNTHYGVLALKLYGDSYGWQFIDTQGHVLDESKSKVACHNAPNAQVSTPPAPTSTTPSPQPTVTSPANNSGTGLTAQYDNGQVNLVATLKGTGGVQTVAFQALKQDPSDNKYKAYLFGKDTFEFPVSETIRWSPKTKGAGNYRFIMLINGKPVQTKDVTVPAP